MKTKTHHHSYFNHCHCAVAFTAQAQNSGTTFQAVAKEIAAPIQNIFVPQGFDSNDNSE